MYSLDTHVFLWWLDEPSLLSSAARKVIEDGSSVVYVSAAVPWEIAVKRAAGKLRFDHDPIAMMAENRFLSLPITAAHGVAAAELPLHHRDPFDRILIAQAQIEGLTLITRDLEISHYSVPVLAA